MKPASAHIFLNDVVLFVSKAMMGSHHFPTLFFFRSTSLFAQHRPIQRNYPADVPMNVVHQQLTDRSNTPLPSQGALAQRARRVKERAV
jgi:hypothetical protein